MLVLAVSSLFPLRCPTTMLHLRTVHTVSKKSSLTTLVLRVSNNGKLFTSASLDKILINYSNETLAKISQLNGHSQGITDLSWSSDSTYIFSASDDGSCKIWDTATGALLKTPIDDKVPAVSFAKFSPNGKFILVATLDDTLKLWNYSAGKFLKIYTGHTNKVYCLMPTISVTGEKYIVSGSEHRCVYLWDLQGKNMVQKLEGHTDTVIYVSCHPLDCYAGLDNMIEQ